MRKRQLYGHDYDLPANEGFRYRASGLRHEMTLCDYCLQGNRRCQDAKRIRRNWQKNWKAHRRVRWH